MNQAPVRNRALVLCLVTLTVAMLPATGFAAALPDSLSDTASTAVASRFAQLEARLPALQALLAQCRTRGIPTAYEMVDVTTIQQFLPWGRTTRHPGYAISQRRRVSVRVPSFDPSLMIVVVPHTTAEPDSPSL